MLRLPVPYVAPRPAARLAIFPSWHSIALIAMRHRNLALALVVASALSAAVATWALIGHEREATRSIDAGLFSESSINRCPDLQERIAEFEKIGRSASPD